ncbi:transcription initiation factor TFIID subunit 12 [Phymastichus coffea]|uniref:transcription initiation factor TFIID subunit 12 n=1 Tax=Phymastichus coffea TaxID=108790 RepID=UPI00273AF162|nr:transcription initiation factor TFIID subunit 12 [Phymastichus coffea]
MSQDISGMQTAGVNSEVPTTLGNIPSVNSTSQIPNMNPTLQTSVHSQPQQQPPQQQQFTPQIKSQPQQLPQSNTQNASLDYHQFLTKSRLQDLVKEIDPTEQLDEEVEEMLLQLADDFVETTINAACLLAKHRHANTVEVKDVQLHLEKNWNMWIPGFGTDEIRPYKRATVTEAHKQRLALIRKSIKKY